MKIFLHLFLFLLLLKNALAISSEPVRKNNQRKTSFIATMITGFSYGHGYKLYQTGLNQMTHEMGIGFDFFHYTHGDRLQDMFQSLNGFDCRDGQESPESQKIGHIIYVTSWGTNKGRWLANEFQRRCGRKVDLFVILDGVDKPSVNPSYIRPVSYQCVNYYQDRSILQGAPINGCLNINLSYLCDESLADGRGIFDCHRKLHILNKSKLLIYDLLATYIRYNWQLKQSKF